MLRILGTIVRIHYLKNEQGFATLTLSSGQPGDRSLVSIRCHRHMLVTLRPQDPVMVLAFPSAVFLHFTASASLELTATQISALEPLQARTLGIHELKSWDTPDQRLPQTTAPQD